VTIGTPIVLSVFNDWYSVLIVKNIQKTVKQQKNDYWCTNRHMSTQSPQNTQSRANAATSRDLHHMCLGSGHSPSSVGRADCMCLNGRSCVWLPFAAACCYTLFYLLMPTARLVCQRPSSNFPYFRTPLANFLLSRPNSVEYGNSKTTTLLHSAKCTRPLFQGRTGCGGRPSGWHDIVTCQHLVSVKSFCVKFCDFVGNSYPNISTNFCTFILTFHQMALTFPPVPIVFTMSIFCVFTHKMKIFPLPSLKTMSVKC